MTTPAPRVVPTRRGYYGSSSDAKAASPKLEPQANKLSVKIRELLQPALEKVSDWISEHPETVQQHFPDDDEKPDLDYMGLLPASTNRLVVVTVPSATGAQLFSAMAFEYKLAVLAAMDLSDKNHLERTQQFLLSTPACLRWELMSHNSLQELAANLTVPLYKNGEEESLYKWSVARIQGLTQLSSETVMKEEDDRVETSQPDEIVEPHGRLPITDTQCDDSEPPQSEFSATIQELLGPAVRDLWTWIHENPRTLDGDFPEDAENPDLSYMSLLPAGLKRLLATAPEATGSRLFAAMAFEDKLAVLASTEMEQDDLEKTRRLIAGTECCTRWDLLQYEDSLGDVMKSLSCRWFADEEFLPICRHEFRRIRGLPGSNGGTGRENKDILPDDNIDALQKSSERRAFAIGAGSQNFRLPTNSSDSELDSYDKLWTTVFASLNWLETTAAKKSHIVLFGADLNRMARSPKQPHWALAVNDLEGDIQYEDKLFLDSLRRPYKSAKRIQHQYDLEHVKLTAGCFSVPEVLGKDFRDLFSTAGGQLQTQYCYWGDGQRKIRTLTSKDILGIGGPISHTEKLGPIFLLNIEAPAQSLAGPYRMYGNIPEQFIFRCFGGVSFSGGHPPLVDVMEGSVGHDGEHTFAGFKFLKTEYEQMDRQKTDWTAVAQKETSADCSVIYGY